MTGFIVSVFPFPNRVSPKEAFEELELSEGKPSRPVLRGPGGRKAAWLLGRNHSGSVAIIRAALSISSQKHLRQAPEGEGADRGYQAEQVPTVAAEMQDAQAVRQRYEGDQEEERSGEVTVHAPTAKRVDNARRTHYGERDGPDDCSPTVADSQRPDCDHRGGWKPIQHENSPSA
jgi:hypothetical protein